MLKINVASASDELICPKYERLSIWFNIKTFQDVYGKQNDGLHFCTTEGYVLQAGIFDVYISLADFYNIALLLFLMVKLTDYQCIIFA